MRISRALANRGFAVLRFDFTGLGESDGDFASSTFSGSVRDLVAAAAAMAAGVRERLGATYGMATTGVAGPGPAEGKAQGTVFVAVEGPAGPAGTGLQLAGDRRRVREGSVLSVLSLLVSALREDDS